MKQRRDFIKSAALSSLAIASWSNLVGNEGNGKFEPQSVAKGILEGLPEITREDYLERQKKAISLMEQRGLDALFVEGGVNLGFFTNVSWWSSERVFGFLMSPYADITWICPAFEEKRASEIIGYGKEIMVWQEHESPYRLFRQYLDKIGRPSGKVGMDPNARSFVVEGIRRELKDQVTDGSYITETTRAVKSGKEIILMDAANRITKKAFKASFSQLKEGMEPEELGDLISKNHTEMGAGGGGMVMFGPNAAFPHGTRNPRKLQQGDVVLVDGGCSLKGYKSDVTRTAIFGNPSPETKKVFETVWNAQQAAFKAIKPGAICSDVDTAARKEMEKGGFGADYEYFTHRLGHGIGVEGHEYPYLVRGNPLVMKSGMTFTNEPGLYLMGKLGVRIEDSLAVTDEGYRILGGMPCKSMDDILSDTL